jgi:hypothetical protein
VDVIDLGAARRAKRHHAARPAGGYADARAGTSCAQEEESAGASAPFSWRTSLLFIAFASAVLWSLPAALLIALVR